MAWNAFLEDLTNDCAGRSENYCFLIKHVLPLVRQLGATDEQIDKVVVDNPRRFFAGLQ
eukprot:COSAG04_NODE_1381_length_6993_cov_41.974471_3_plen_59_part_00